MKHITEQYGIKTNKIECTPEEYQIIQAFFSKMGIEIRTVLYSRERVEFQAQNPYKSLCEFYGNRKTGKEIAEQAEEYIKEGVWFS